MNTFNKFMVYVLPLTLLTPSLSAALDPINEEDGSSDQVMTIWSSPITATSDILAQNQLREFNTPNVAEALNTMPGVILQKSGNRNELQVSVRGFDSRQVGLFFDGIPIYIPYDGNLDLGRFLSTDLESIEVSKGYASLLQGPNMMGGAINLTTSRPKKVFEAEMGFSQGWSRNHDSGYQVNGGLGSKTDIGFIQVSGSQLSRSFIGLPYGTNNAVAGTHGKRANADTQDKRGTLKIGITPNDSDEYVFTYINQTGDKNSAPYAGTANQATRYWQWPDYDKESFYYNGVSRISDNATLLTRAYHDTFKNTLMMYNSLADLNNKAGNYSHYDDYSNGAGVQLSLDLRQADVWSFSGHWKNDAHREKGAMNAPNDIYKDQTYSIASEYQWAAGGNTDVVGGISYDRRESVKAMKHLSGGSIINYDDNDSDAFNWQALIKQCFDNRDEIQFTVAERSRFATLKERYTTSRPALGQTAIVNPNLNSERALNVELRYKGYFSEHWGYDSSVYYNRVKDAILAHNISPTVVQNRNSGRVDYSGFDLGINGKLSDYFTAGLNYGYIHSDVKNKSIGEITGLPKNKLFAWLKAQPTPALSFTVMQEARSWSHSNSNGRQKARGFAKTDIRSDYNVGGGFSVNASVNNVFDKDYAYTEGFIEEGRNYWLGVNYRY
jgi:iron complex outermembrane receptor protein